MSMRYKGSVMSATPPTSSQTSASGAWTLEQQMQATAAGLWPVNGPFYIEDVFSTWLYTGNSSTQTVTNGIDLANKGGLVWIKGRQTAFSHILVDTVRGPTKYLSSNNTTAELTAANTVPSFSSTGFTAGTDNQVNLSGDPFVSWTFREQPKFFDVVTYTGNGVAGRTVAHNLGSVPGCMIVKRTDAVGGWYVYHTSLGATQNLQLSSPLAAGTRTQIWNDTAPTSTVFSLGTDTDVNASGGTYVAYLFAHNAGGFGLTGTDNVISCGSFTTDGSGNATVSLGYEPQWLVFKPSSGAGNWQMVDNMRGWTADGTGTARLFPNTSGAEVTTSVISGVNATGFNNFNGSASTDYIYIAIRRGPMKVPTIGTSVFSPNTAVGGAAITTNFPVDGSISSETGASTGASWGSRLQGTKQYLLSYNTSAEATFGGTGWGFDSNTRLNQALYGGSTPSVFWNFQRAPGYFDVVCYTGDGVNGRAISHNLTVAPELIMVKSRSASADWAVYANGPVGCLILNATNAANGIANFPVGTPTATTFSVASSSGVNGSGSTFVAYLFATCPGVSKVGSFTGTGGTQVINCGFTAGSRFVLIKATSTTGSWYVWDSARGIVAGNDPYLTLNTTAAEVTTTDWVDTAATGFELSNAGGNLANSNGVSYIFLAIA